MEWALSMQKKNIGGGGGGGGGSSAVAVATVGGRCAVFRCMSQDK